MKKKTMKKTAKETDDGMGALLELLKDRPELVHALIFDHAKVKRLLKSKAARQLVLGVDARKILQKRVAGAGRAGPAAMCLRGTKVLVRREPREIHPDCFGNTWLLTTLLCCFERQTWLL